MKKELKSKLGIRERNIQIIGELKRGMLHKEVAEKYGISRVWVSKIAKKAGVNKIRRERNPDLNQKIVQYLNQDLKPKEIASRLNITTTWVYIFAKKKGLKIKK